MITWSELVDPIEAWWDDMEAWFEARGVSPVIGAILMVSITIVLSAVMMFFVTTAEVGVNDVNANTDLYEMDSGQVVMEVDDMGTATEVQLQCDGEPRGDPVTTSDLEDGYEERTLREDCSHVSAIALDEDGNERMLRGYPTGGNNIPTATGSKSTPATPSADASCLDQLEQDESGAYLIKTDYDLQCLAEVSSDETDATFKLANDVDASGTSEWNNGAGFKPIPKFQGTFNGQNYELSGLAVNRPETSSVGLFGKTMAGSEVKNLDLRSVDITGENKVGGLTGTTGDSVSITNVYVSGSVSGNSNVGGIVGILHGDVGADSADGSKSVESMATITGSTNTGGIVGKFSTGRIVDAMSNSSVTGGDDTGGLVGKMNAGSISDSRSLQDVSGGENVGGFIGNIGGGTVSDSYADGGHVTGSTNIGGFAGKTNAETIDNTWASAKVTATSKYAGGHTGFVEGTIKNSHATGTVHSQGQYAGGFAGEVKGVTISDSYATGDVSGDGTYAGGFISYIGPDSTVENGSAEGRVHGTKYVGGFVGRTYGTVNDSFATGDVAGDDERIGGFVGQASAGDISRAYAEGDATAGNRLVGGFAGGASGAITDAYALGDVDGGSNAGGFLGSRTEAADGTMGQVDNAFSVGTVTYTNEKSGPFVGASTSGVFNAVFYHQYEAGMSDNNADGLPSNADMKGTPHADIQSAFDFDTVWEYGDTSSDATESEQYITLQNVGPQ